MNIIKSRDPYQYSNCLDTAYDYGWNVSLLGALYDDFVEFPNQLIHYLNDLCYKYNFPNPPLPLIKNVFSLAVEYVDYFNPYFLLELSNIKKTEDKYYYQFKLNSDSIVFLNPNEFDTFSSKDYDYNELFNAYMNPWFNSENMINEFNELESIETFILHDHEFTLTEIIDKYNLNDIKIIELLINSILIWMISPSDEAIKWRINYLRIFDTCHNNNEGILFYDMTVLSPSQYIKLNIPTQVCVICNQRLPCSKLIRYQGNTVYYCNNHIELNKESIDVIDDEISFNYEGECHYDCNNCQISSCLFSKRKLSVRNFEKEQYRFMIAKEVIKKNPELKSKFKLSTALSLLSNKKMLK